MTVVEWLQEKYKQQGTIFNLQFEQAKEMEKKQIIDAHSDWSRITENLPTRSAEQYYKQTFKSE